MKSVTIKQPGQLSILEKNVPEPRMGEVRVKVKSASICGSDAHIWHGHNPFATYPRTIGHEFFGIVDAVGEGVDKRLIDQRVVIDPVVSCGKCYPCSIGRPNVCTELQVIGVHRDGGFADYVCAPASNAHDLPATIPDSVASLIEPFSIAANISAYVAPRENDIALVYGAGPIGITVIQTLKGVYRVGTVIVVDRIQSRLDMALNNGADIVLNNASMPLSEQLDEQHPTLIIDAACHPSILPEAIALASPAARIGILGFSSDACTLTQQAITSKEISLFSSRLNSGRFPSVIQWVKDGLIDPRKLITHRFPLVRAEEAMTLFDQSQDNCCKVILDISE